MPIEYSQLKDKPYPIEDCPVCDVKSIEYMMRGLVQSCWRRLLHMNYCAVICRNCKNVIGWERP